MARKQKKQVLLYHFFVFFLLIVYSLPTNAFGGEDSQSKADRYLTRAKTFVEKKNYPRAISELNKVLKIEPNSVIAYNLLAKTYEKQGDLTRAVNALKKIAEIAPNSTAYRVALANIYIKQDNVEQDIIDEIKEALQTNPKDVYLYLALGNLYAKQGKFFSPSEAIFHYKEFVRLAQGHQLAKEIEKKIKELEKIINKDI